jgi:hypothetical protein
MEVTNPGFNPSNSDEIKAIKEAGVALQNVIEASAPNNRRRSIALTHLETALMFAVKAVVEP